MDEPNITMEEYIRLKEEKAQKRRKVFNWETAKYGRIWYDEDVHDLRSVETEFPAIIFNDNLTSNKTLSCEPTVSFLNDNEIDFRISFDESDDEDYTVVYDENSFSYKIISVKNLKTDSENDNEKVNMPLFPSPSPRHIDEFDLKDETSLSECDEKEQNVLYFNDLLPFNVIYPDDLKLDTDNDIDKIDIEQPSGDMSVIPSPNIWHHLPTADQRHGLDTRSRDIPRVLYTVISRGSRPYGATQLLIMESLVKKKQKGAILELKRRHLKNTIFCTYTPYPAMKIRRISANSAQETRNDQFPIRRIHYNQYAVCTAVHQSKIRI
ncbi:hypothetical protein Tco_0790468 [Tanacetum coccineum]